MYTLVFHSEYKKNNVVVNTLQYDRLITLDNFENLLISISKMFFSLQINVSVLPSSILIRSSQKKIYFMTGPGLFWLILKID